MPSPKKDLRGLRVLVTAGPTREYIDPVRFLSNPSTGRMGYAIAAVARRRGADVILISGPTELPRPRDVTVIEVTSAAEMYHATIKEFMKSDLIFKAAAVADWHPQKQGKQKTKKQGRKDWKLTLVPTRDILATLGKRKKKKQILVGFAAETDRVTKNAREKLQTKGLDLIVVNNISKKGIGFGSSHNQVTVFFANGEKKTLPRLTKERLADRLLSLSLKGITRR